MLTKIVVCVELRAVTRSNDPVQPSSVLRVVFQEDLELADDWFEMVPGINGRPPPMWGSTFLSKKVLITRNELLTLLRTKLEMQETWENISHLARNIHIQCFGVASLFIDGTRRRIVGTSTVCPERRDVMRLKRDLVNDVANRDTALTVQIIAFVTATGLGTHGVSVPDTLTLPENETCNSDQVTFALVRWLEADSRCLLRDSRSLPLCPPPFGSNHALWTFAKRRNQRGYFQDHLFARQLHLFPGKDRATRRRNAKDMTHARYDLIQLESIESYVNCTFIDNNQNSIMETVTLPFN